MPPKEAQEDLEVQEDKMSKDKKDLITTMHYEIDPESIAGLDFPPIVTPEMEQTIKKMYESHPELKQQTIEEMSAINDRNMGYTTGSTKYSKEDAWIQTFSGRCFNPTNPNPNAIVIQDIAHALSMQCRFSGHVKKFYSVAQHSVGVSYLCDEQDALWGLLHDGSEAYLVDIPRPLKHSGKFDAYLEFEKTMQKAICTRFELPEQEPESVKRADTLILMAEARDLMSPLHPDWTLAMDPPPFKIDSLSPQEAEHLFMKRFFDLIGHKGAYTDYTL